MLMEIVCYIAVTISKNLQYGFTENMLQKLSTPLRKLLQCLGLRVLSLCIRKKTIFAIK